MAHVHIIVDHDKHFIIDPITKKIQPENPEKNKLVRYDHNSERYTFEMDRMLEGHDMSLCDIVQIHYINVSSNKQKKNEDIYEVNDLGLLSGNEDRIAFTWLVSRNATMLDGILTFAIRFACSNGDSIDYELHTEIFSSISISNTIINNGQSIVEEYSDILNQWKKELFGIEGTIQTAKRESLAAIDKNRTDSLNAINSDSRKAIDAINFARESSLEAIDRYGLVQVSEEDPTNPNIDVHINPNTTESFTVPEIIDDSIGPEDTWSSEKINTELSKVNTDVTALKEDLSAITDTETKIETHNIEQNVIKTSNYYWNGKPTANTDYFYVHLDNLQEGDIITAIIDSAYHTMRFVDAYNGTNRVSSASVSSDTSLYTVPSGVDNVYITCLMRYVNDISFYVKRTVTVNTITPKGFDVLNKKVGEISEKQDKIYANKSKNISIRGNLTTGNTLSTFVPNILTLKHLSFVCNLDTMGEIKIGHGENLNSIVVTDTELRTYYWTTLLRTKQHELTITKDLQIKIDVDANGNPKITIQSQGISYEYTDWNWFGNEENIFVESVNGAFNDCILSWSCDGFFKDIQLYGDSYFSCIDNSRWTKHLLNAGYTNNLLDGFSGRKSSQAYTSLIENLKYSNPKTIIWCMGMNDDDGDAVNEQWADYYEKVKTLCEENNIELILATIPNTPIRNHIYKNEIVRNSGYRYIDFAKAVNAESSGASWYDGMLNGDKVHPTELGAKTLYMRALADVPELMCS